MCDSFASKVLLNTSCVTVLFQKYKKCLETGSGQKWQENRRKDLKCLNTEENYKILWRYHLLWLKVSAPPPSVAAEDDPGSSAAHEPVLVHFLLPNQTLCWSHILYAPVSRSRTIPWPIKQYNPLKISLPENKNCPETGKQYQETGENKRGLETGDN